MRNIKLVALAVAAVILLIVALQNSATATVHILFARVTMPMAMMLLVMLVCGGAIGAAITAALTRRKR